MSGGGSGEGRRGAGRHRLLVTAVLLAVLVMSFRAFASYADRASLAVAALALVVLVVLLLDWLGEALLPSAWRLAKAAGRGAAAAVAGDPETARLETRHPRLIAWVCGRVTTATWRGLYLTLTVLAALWFLSIFVQVALDVRGVSVLSAYDAHVSALLQAFRAPAFTTVLWVATILGDPWVMVAIAALTAAVLALWGRRAEAVVLVAAMLSGQLAVDTIKLVAARVRPSAALALIRTPSSFSFPSGHAFASLVLFGLLGLMLARRLKGFRPRALVLTACAAAVALIGLSRVYLGVHWLSDVLASWALAAAWISAAFGAYLSWLRYGRGRTSWPPVWTRRARVALAVALAAVVSAAVVAGALSDPLLRVAVAAQPVRALPASPGPVPSAAAVLTMPHVTEKLDGTPQEPIGLVFLGDRASLTDAFAKAGWSVADPATPFTLAKAGLAALRNEPYPNAPVTPAFLGGKMQDLAFEKPVGTATVRRRHHARFWSLPYTIAGKPVWVATASLDVGLEVGPAVPVPTHHIDANVDKERDFVVAELTRTGSVVRTGQVRVTTPEAGTNQQGDSFFTQGLATVLEAR